MFKSIKRASLVAALAVGAMTVSTASAEARDRYWRHRGGDDAAIAIGAGIVGLALGAAVASGNRGYYYDDYYYGRPRGYYYRSYPRYRTYYYRTYPRYRTQYYYRGDRWDRGYDRWGRGRYYGGW